MLFNFHAYLASFDPPQVYSISVLTGGLVNETVRAVKQGLSSDLGPFAGYSSVVIKYAPPFVASLGERVPFSQARQTVEANALALFSRDHKGLASICDETGVSVPKLLHHDEASKILVMSDLGVVPNLTDLLSPSHEFPLTSPVGCIFGARLGEFFAKLHSQSAYHLVSLQYPTYFQDRDDTSKKLIYQLTVLPIEGYLNDFAIADAAELSRRVAADHHGADSDSVRSFVLGDSWPGAILVNAIDPASPAISVIDWEFAGIGRGVTGDIVQLLAHLHLHRLAAAEASPLRQATEALMLSMVCSYRSEAQKQGRTWAQGLFSSAMPNAVSRAMRSAFLLLGREIINNAIERDWACLCCQSRPKMGDGCELRREMVHLGAWYLRAARADEADFCREESLHSALAGDVYLRELFLGEALKLQV